MLLTRKDKNGYIYAYFEWDIVDVDGRTKDYGIYMHVRDLWIHDYYKNQNIIWKLVEEVEKYPQNIWVEWIYWDRQKRLKKLGRLFSKKTCMRRLKCLYSTV